MRRWRQSVRVSLAATVILAVAVAAVSPAQAQDPTIAPVTSRADGGRVVSGEGKTLTASQVGDLDPNGQSVTVTGSGYDVNKGVYVTFCVLPPANTPPTPCGGGQDQTGAAATSTWISSNPPTYAAGLTTPYGPGGAFSLTLVISPRINDAVDCTSVPCAIVTRNDHTRSTDRSQDLFLPVTFAAASPAPPGPVTTLPPVVASTDPTTSVAAPVTTAAPLPTTVTSVQASVLVSDSDDEGEGTGTALALAGAGVGVAAVGGAIALRLRRRGSMPADDPS